MKKTNVVAKVTSRMTVHGKIYEGRIVMNKRHPPYIYKLIFIKPIYLIEQDAKKPNENIDFIKKNIIIELVCGLDYEDNFIYKEIEFNSSLFILFYNLIVELAASLYHESETCYHDNHFKKPVKRFEVEKSIAILAKNKTEMKQLSKILGC